MNKSIKEEEKLGKVYDGRLMRQLIGYLKPYKLRVLLATLFLVVTALGQIAGPIISQQAIDIHIQNGDYDGLLKMVLLYVAVLFVVLVFQYFHFYLMQMIGQNVMYDLRSQIFSHFQSRSVSFFDKNPIGRLVTRLTSDIDALNEMFTSGVVTIFGDILLIFGILTVMFLYNVKLTLIAIAVLPLLFAAAFLFKLKVRQSLRVVRVLIARINSFLQENIVGMKVVQLFNREGRNYAEFERINRDHLNVWLKTILYYAVFFPTVEVLSATAIALIIWFGVLDIYTGVLTFGALFLFIRYAQMFYRPIQDLSDKYNILQSAMASAERIFKLLDSTDEIVDAPDAAEFATLDGEIEFRNVWFAYNPDDWVLKDVSFHIGAGEKIAVVGATGAGKTTLTNLITRFYDVQRGAVLLDGRNVRDMKKLSLRRHLGIVLQDVYLFSGTVRENITIGNDGIGDDRVLQALKDVHAYDFVSRLDKGLDTEVRERGSNFSTGQKQLLAFARALVYDPRILMLDEATSNVDTETELLIQKALNRLMQGRTSIVVAHRLSTVKNVDRIMVMHKGRLAEIGTHAELLSNRGIYYRLYQLQYKEQEIQAGTS